MLKKHNVFLSTFFILQLLNYIYYNRWRGYKDEFEAKVSQHFVTLASTPIHDQ